MIVFMLSLQAGYLVTQLSILISSIQVVESDAFFILFISSLSSTGFASIPNVPGA